MWKKPPKNTTHCRGTSILNREFNFSSSKEKQSRNILAPTTEAVAGNCGVKSYFGASWSHIMMAAAEEVPGDFITQTSQWDWDYCSPAFSRSTSWCLPWNTPCRTVKKKQASTKRGQEAKTPTCSAFWQQQHFVLRDLLLFSLRSFFPYRCMKLFPFVFLKEHRRPDGCATMLSQIQTCTSCFFPLILLTAVLPIMRCPGIQPGWHTTLQLRQLHDSKLQLVAAISLSAANDVA